VRGLVRSLHSNFGFEPRGALLVRTDLSMAGYKDDGVATMQKRMIDMISSTPGVSSVGLVNIPPMEPACCNESDIFTDASSDLRPSNAAARAVRFSVSPEYLGAAGTPLLARLADITKWKMELAFKSSGLSKTENTLRT
jgi:hypothetical protein